MKNVLFLLCTIFSMPLFSQIDFDKHIKSINDTYFEAEDRKGVFNANERAVNYALKYLKDNGVEQKYITNRKLLNKIKTEECKDSSYIYFSDKLKNSTEIKVKIKFKKFDQSKHIITEVENANHIDAQIAFGAYYGLPVLEINCLEIKINGKAVNVPKSVYTKFYDVTQCEGYLFYEPIEVYSSNDGEYIFIYLKGGNSANTYFAKLIFNREKFVAEIVADYSTLIEWQAFNNKDFIGF